jgi:hypothetical protein
VDEGNARVFVENLLDRLEQDGTKYRLPGGTLTAREIQALSVLAGLGTVAPFAKPKSLTDSPPQAQHPLDVQCLTASCDIDQILCVDFGTAFSKAAVWNQLEEKPVPLPIGKGISSDPLLIDSVVYIGATKIYFGPRALREFGEDGDKDREIFTSPKEILNLDYETMRTDRPTKGVDPRRLFKKKDLLILFLGFLTALTKRELAVIGVNKPVKRRFAAPGWGDAQQNIGGERFDLLVTQMRRFLGEAQILADSFNIYDWVEGIDVEKATSAISQLSSIGDDQLLSATFIERPVLEVTAAASSIKERLLNKRPQVIVVDVGAGTTDIGAFKYVGTADEPKFAAYKQGMAALDLAGNRLDDALKMMVRKKLNIGSDSTAKPAVDRDLAQNIHRYKKDLFANEKVTISITGLPDVLIKLPEFLKNSYVKNFQDKFKDKVVQLLNAADEAGGASFTDVASDNYVVFTGGGGGLPFLHSAFEDGIKLKKGRAYFERIKPRPSWLDDATEEVRAIFPQIAVAVGGASPDLPRELHTVGDTSMAASRTIKPTYKS